MEIGYQAAVPGDIAAKTVRAMAAARKIILHSVAALLVIGIVLTGGWAAYMWYIYSYDSGLTKPVKDEAYKTAQTVQVMPLRDGLYMLQGDGGNVTALAGDDQVLIVDTDEAWMARRIEAALQTLSDQPVRYVIDTHHHGDHRGGNGYFRRKGAEIIAQTNAAANIKVDDYAKAGPEEFPTLTFDSEYTLTSNGETVHLTHFPNAHTDGDIVVYFENANVLATGDLFSFGSYPFISAGTHGTIDGHLAAQRHMLSMIDDDTLIVPGHGALARKADLQETNERLTAIRDYVATLKSLGVSRSLARAFYPTFAWRTDWRDAYVTDKHFLALVYNTLPDGDLDQSRMADAEAAPENTVETPR